MSEGPAPWPIIRWREVSEDAEVGSGSRRLDIKFLQMIDIGMFLTCQENGNQFLFSTSSRGRQKQNIVNNFEGDPRRSCGILRRPQRFPVPSLIFTVESVAFIEQDIAFSAPFYSPFPMSTGLDLRRRQGLWSYFSFGSTSHRRTVSSPERHELKQQEREDTPTKSSWGGRGRADTLEGYRTEPSMTGGQRSRYLKTGGIIVLVLFLLYLFSSKGGDGVREIVKGMFLEP